MRYRIGGVDFICSAPYWLARPELESWAKSYKKDKDRLCGRILGALPEKYDISEQSLLAGMSRPSVDFGLNEMTFRVARPDGKTLRVRAPLREGGDIIDFAQLEAVPDVSGMSRKFYKSDG